MAEGILSGIVGNIITKLGSEALRELGLILGVNDEFQRLRRTVSAIQAVILDAEEQQSKSHTVKNWITSLRDALYDIDDLIDEFSYEKMRRRVMIKRKTKQLRLFFSRANQIIFRFKMGRKIRDMRDRLDAINADRTQFNFSERLKATQDCQLSQRRETHSFIPEDLVIGRDDDRKAIIDVLLDTDVRDNVSVVAIVGMGGLGKTALAQYVYNNEKITEHFELRLWVCIYEVFDVKVIVENIIESATKENPGSLNMDTLQSTLRQKIDGKRYLLLLDDVWNESHEEWDKLKMLLMGGVKGSKIMITTRGERVADTCRAVKKYSLSSLSEDKSWLLFQRMAFKGGIEPENKKLIEIGKDIVAKLKGVPLAIRTIGRLLSLKESVDDWLSFKDNELDKIMQQENEMQPILMLSYNHLPFNLKRCFTYCALFPKDTMIRKHRLIKQWVAQGFVQPTDSLNKTMEDVGHDYFMELLWRSFFQDIEKNDCGDIEGCKIHDLMHDLACSIVENEYRTTSMGTASCTIDRSTRHISLLVKFYHGELELPESLFEAKNLRALILLPYFHEYRFSTYDRLISNFLRLRILDLHRCEIEELPEFIGKLKHLRYLDLSWNMGIRSLPNSITELYNLETFCLRNCIRLRNLAINARNWINLRHLDIIGCDGLAYMPKGLGGLTGLQTLNMFVVQKDDGSQLSELKRLNNLKGSLSIRGLEFHRGIDLSDNILKEKSGLRELRLEFDHERNDSDDHERVLEHLQPHPNVQQLYLNDYKGLRLPDWLSSLHLIRIELSLCTALQGLPRFHQFPFLKHLYLYDLTSMEYIDNSGSLGSSSMFFPCLLTLTISGMSNLKGWWNGETLMESAQTIVSHPIFPHLCKMEISHCYQLISFPRLPCLQSLKIRHVSLSFLYTIMEMIPRLGKGSSSSSGLHSLKLEGITDLEFLSEELLCKLSMLESLKIGCCENLKMSGILVKQRLVKGDDADILWKKLENLRILRLSVLPKMECVPTGLLYLSTLQEFDIDDCENLMDLPECMGNLTSLRSLKISSCPKLTSLPKGMHHLTSLSTLFISNCCNLTSLPDEMRDLHSFQSLTIWRCPKLIKGCQENGLEWPKIRHVPHLKLWQ